MFDAISGLPRERRWRQQNYPAPIVVALIRRVLTGPGVEPPAVCYLLIRRNSQPYANRWALVGGKWNFGETLSQAVLREVKEETGLEATFIGFRGLLSERIAPADAEDLGAHFLLFACDLAAPAGEPREQKEGAVAWFTLAQIQELHQQMAIVPTDFQLICRFADSAAPAPHYEADMLTAIEREKRSHTHLFRFERIDQARMDRSSGAKYE